MENAFNVQERVYKSVDGHELQVRLFAPEDGRTDRPAVIFFFGGGWQKGTWEQFRTHSELLASQGIFAMTAQYRIGSVHGTSGVACVEDARDMFTWAVHHAAELGIDPTRIAVGGGSAGGHLALCVGVLPVDEAVRGARGGIGPKAMVLFNPACRIQEGDVGWDRFEGRAQEFSPYRYVAAGQPPTLLFHGTADTTVPFDSAVAFAEKMKEHGNECTVVPYEGRKHGFFNRGKTESDEDYKDSKQRMLVFLRERLA